MKKIIAMAFAALLCGCSNDKPVLHVYNWSEYIDPELIAKFERENDCRVSIDTFDDNEAMLAKFFAGSAGYDVVFPSSYIVETMKRRGFIQKLDTNKLHNVLSNFDEKYAKLVHDKNFEYSVPYAFSMTGVCYRKDKSKEIDVRVNSWNVFFEKCFAGKICVLNDIREMIGISLKINGFSVNSTNDAELETALNTALKFKSVASKLDNIQYKTGIMCDEFYICMGYNSDMLQLKSESSENNIEFFIPDEGSTCCFDEMCVAEKSKNVELAHKFIDFLYDEKNAAANSKYICTAVPNKRMWKHLSDEDVSDPLFNVPSDVLNRLELIEDLGQNLRKHNAIWDRFKAATTE